MTIKKNKLINILNDYNIPYALVGKNIKPGFIGVCCPICGDDYSYHCGINPDKNFFACWRNSEHKGNLKQLLVALLGISEQEARIILKNDDFSLDFSDELCYTKEVIKGKGSIVMPDNFYTITYDDIVTRPFYNYLIGRRFDDIDILVDKYNIKCCISGDWKNRIIFPLYFQNQLVSWVGRSIESTPFLRYKDLSIENSVRYAKKCLHNFDNLRGGEILFVCEGIFDAMKLDFYSSNEINATCILTTTMTDEQITLLSRINNLYNKVIILLDKGVEFQSLVLSEKLSFMNNIVMKLFDYKNYKDAGELSKKQIKEFIDIII